MDILLPRFAYTPTETQGRLLVGEWSCYTIERPWRRWSVPGGQPFESCIPDGNYDLVPFMRPNGDKVFAIVNPDLGVHFQEADRPKDSNGQRQGRYLCLIHPANYVDDVVGCIGPGKIRTIDTSRHKIMVTSSRVAMTEILAHVGWESGHRLKISQAPGAIDTPLAIL